MIDPHLNFAKVKYLAIRDKILADNPDIDDQTLADTVEGLSELPDQLAAIMRDALEAETLAVALQLRIEAMAERMDRFKHKAERRRAVVCDVMLEAGLGKLTMPDFTASIRKGTPHVVIVDEQLIPESFVSYRPHINKREIGDALKDGVQVTGAVLSNPGMVLSVRTK
jgi:CO dehydrogenase/acetyl-CoA synthase alpha subunit